MGKVAGCVSSPEASSAPKYSSTVTSAGDSAPRRKRARTPTSVRTIESALAAGAASLDASRDRQGAVPVPRMSPPGQATAAETDIFIYPGYEFRAAGAMLTNFHLPRTSLLLLVCAFAGTELALAAYRHAVEEQYRFFSYGDCMLIV